MSENKVTPDTIEWQEGRVKNFFGKDLLSLNMGTLKMVKAAPHAHYPEYAHPDKTEYVFVLSGQPDFIIDSENFSGKQNEFFIFPAGKKHAILNNSDTECVLLVGAVKH